MKKVYIIHGWEGRVDEGWFPWLKEELESQEFEVVIPAMPDPETPVREVWTKFLLDLEPNPNTDIYFVGHSMGCQGIQRYLESLPAGAKIGGAVLVAGWIDDPKWADRTEEETKVIENWFEPKKDYSKIKQHCDKFVTIYSNDDPFVLHENWKQAEPELGAKVIMIGNKGHVNDETNVKKLPEALESILEMSKG